MHTMLLDLIDSNASNIWLIAIIEIYPVKNVYRFCYIVVNDFARTKKA